MSSLVRKMWRSRQRQDAITHANGVCNNSSGGQPGDKQMNQNGNSHVTPTNTHNYINNTVNSGSGNYNVQLGSGGASLKDQSQRFSSYHTHMSFVESSCEEMSDQCSNSSRVGETDRRINVRTLSLIVCTVSYLMFGAAIFDLIESENEERQRSVLIEIEGNITAKYNMSLSDKRQLESIYVKLVPYKSGIQWKFTGAFYFVLTVITTIGYGHAAPATPIGKTFCMAYAFIGIPLSLTVYQAVGERLNTFTAWWLMHAKARFFHKPRADVHVTQTELVMAGWSACSLVLFGGAAVFSHYEGWSYFNSLYYCYITLTTIGFGDYIALQNDNALQKEPKYVFFSILYIMIALCVVASSINLLVLKFLTMNTMDEKESAQIEARKQFSHVLRQVAHERASRPSSSECQNEPPSIIRDTNNIVRPKFSTASDFSSWEQTSPVMDRRKHASVGQTHSAARLNRIYKRNDAHKNQYNQMRSSPGSYKPTITMNAADDSNV